ncbi:unnamed protein product [Camellia sinensis]
MNNSKMTTSSSIESSTFSGGTQCRISHHVFKLDDLLGIDPRGTMSNAIEDISEALLSAIGFRKDGGTLSDVFKVDVVPRMNMDDEKLLMGDICQNSGFFQLEPGPNKKAISLPLRDEDYTEDIKEVQAYLDKLCGLGVDMVKKIVRPGCSQQVLNVAVSSMSSLARILSALSSEPKPRASL